jgi:hypothetical protein
VALTTIRLPGHPGRLGTEKDLVPVARHLIEEEKMKAWPACPQNQNFSVLTGFLTPGSDTGPGALDGSISLDVLDPTEGDEKVRAVETTDRWDLLVRWCVCGRFADLVSGCWCVQVFLDDIDGVEARGRRTGRIASKKVSADDGVEVSEGEDTTKFCFEHRFEFGPPGAAQAGVYDLVVVITLSSRDCDDPARTVQDMVGWAVIPVLVFFDEKAPFCAETG